MKPTYEIGGLDAVASDKQRFLGGKIFSLHWLIKYVKRRFFMVLFGQQFLIRDEAQLKPNMRVLWISRSAPSIGDTIMDLSPRKMLANVAVIDLLVANGSADLFENDPHLDCVTNNISIIRTRVVANGQYDFVITDSISPRSLVPKILIAPCVKFASIYGFVNGFEIHRTQFAHVRMALLLDRKIPEKKLALLDRQIISIKKAKRYDLVIGIGGNWSFRKFSSWHLVLQRLRLLGFTGSVALVGSANGYREASLFRDESVDDFVGKLSLKETVSIIASGSFYVGADGGLWHVANALQIPSVVLFAACDIFSVNGERQYRDDDQGIAEVIYAYEDVDEIGVAELADKVFHCLLHRALKRNRLCS